MEGPTPAELRELYADLYRQMHGTEIDHGLGNIQVYMGGREKLTFRDETWYFEWMGLQFGADGSILENNDWVYHVRWHEVLQIDYFHGMSSMYGHAMCQLIRDEADVVAPFMVPIPKLGQKRLCGIINRRIATIQRAWRRWWKEQHHKDIIGLAFFFVDLYAKCRREGLVLPSLDYERKLAARKYGGAHKERRRVQRMINHYERVHGPW